MLHPENTRLIVEKVQNYLLQCNGANCIHLYWMRPYTYTSGVEFVATTTESWWLVDAIMSHQKTNKAAVNAAAGFQVWRLAINGNDAAMLTMDDGNSPENETPRYLIEQAIPYTDFPEALANGDGLVRPLRWYFENDMLLMPQER